MIIIFKVATANGYLQEYNPMKVKQNLASDLSHLADLAACYFLAYPISAFDGSDQRRRDVKFSADGMAAECSY